MIICFFHQLAGAMLDPLLATFWSQLMQVHVDTRMPEAAAWRGQALLSVQRKLLRLSPFLSTVHVRFSDLNGPRGGVDTRCQVTLVTGQGAALHASALALDWQAALVQALRRAVTVLRRRMPARGRAWPRAERLAPDLTT
jgi:hypothetical protein